VNVVQARATRWALAAAALGILAAVVRLEQRAVAVDLGTARDLHGGDHAGSRACRSCHPDHYRSWYRTFHRTMTAEASGAAQAEVRGDFSGATLAHAGVVARMDRDGAGDLRMTFTPEAGGPSRAFAVARSVGSRRVQQYLARVGDTFWRLPVAYQIEERRWFPMTDAFLFSDDAPAASDPARPVFGGGLFDRHVARWNDNCIFCHNVAPDPGRDPATGLFRTQVAELGVACEACHGPGGEHTRRNADPARRMALHLGGGADPTIVNPSRLSPARAADLCGRCHGQRITDDVGPFLTRGDPFVAGDDLALYSAPLWRDTPLGGDGQAFAERFWPDGTARLTAYEYQGLLQSRCAQRGTLTCTSCHGMHDGDPRGQLRDAFSGAAADRMCTRCHEALAAPAALAGHAHHDPAGAGGRCLGCHMPRIVYGVLDVHRSHRVEIPDPAGRAGRPDACTGCHVDETPAWAADALARIWGRPARATPASGLTPVEVLLAGEPLARAVAADAVGRSGAAGSGREREREARHVGVLLEVMANDRYPAVRHQAWRAALRLLSGSAVEPVLAEGYDPSAAAPMRAAAVARLQAALGPRALALDPGVAARLRALAPAPGRDGDVQIGE
jgi:predicted CXXCH cytochrome family protein